MVRLQGSAVGDRTAADLPLSVRLAYLRRNQIFPEFATFAAGANGIAIAPGKQLGIVTGEFGGDLEGVIQLPSTSGTGTPAVTDWWRSPCR